jgi:hypothetical protein
MQDAQCAASHFPRGPAALLDGPYVRFRVILHRTDEAHLEETLRKVFEMPPVAAGITPGEFTVFAAAALGLLLEDPDTQLARIRPRLADWWSRIHDSFVRQGLKE